MIRRKRGVVLNIGSLAGVRMIDAPIHYCASKAAIKGLTEALAKEVARYGIRVLCLAPGLLEDGVGRNLPEHRLADYLKHCALGRVGTFDEVARLAAFLVSDAQQLHVRRDGDRRRRRVGMDAAAPVTIVIGGSGAVGRVVCRTLAARGARVGFTYLTNETVARELTAAIPDSTARRLDVRDIGAIDRTLDEFEALFGRIDALVNCAAVGVAGSHSAPPAHRTHGPTSPRKRWDTMLAVNTKASFFAVRRVARLMRDRGGVNVVLLGSIDGVKPAPAPVHYAASKAALRGYDPGDGQGARAREASRVNSVAPGVLDDGLSRDAAGATAPRIPETLRPEAVRTHRGSREPGHVAGRREHARHRPDPGSRRSVVA